MPCSVERITRKAPVPMDDLLDPATLAAHTSSMRAFNPHNIRYG